MEQTNNIDNAQISNEVIAFVEWIKELLILRKKGDVRPEAYNLCYECREKVRALSKTKPKGWFQQCVYIYSTYIEYAPNKLDNWDYACLIYEYGLLLGHGNQYELAEPYLAKSMGYMKTFAEIMPEEHELNYAQALTNLAIVHSEMQRYEEAAREYTDVAKIYLRLSENHPEAYKPYVMQYLNESAWCRYLQNENLQAAELDSKRAVSLAQEYSPQDYANMLDTLAAIHHAMGMEQVARAEYQEVLDAYRRMDEENPGAYAIQIRETEEKLKEFHSV